MFCLSKSEIRRVLGAINLDKYVFGRRDYLLILFLYHTGLRVGEVSGLTVGLVSCASEALPPRYREPRHFLHLPAAICKGSRGRVVPLNEVAQECVRKILTFNNQLGLSEAPEAPLFNNRVGGHLSVRSIQQLIALYRDAAGLDVRATPHTFRHSNASHLVAAGVPKAEGVQAAGATQSASVGACSKAVGSSPAEFDASLRHGQQRRACPVKPRPRVRAFLERIKKGDDRY